MDEGGQEGVSGKIGDICIGIGVGVGIGTGIGISARDGHCIGH